MNLRQVIRCRCHQVTIEDDLRQVIRCRCHQVAVEDDLRQVIRCRCHQVTIEDEPPAGYLLQMPPGDDGSR